VTQVPDREDFLWMMAGAAVLFVVILAIFALRRPGSPTAELARKAERVDTVERMRIGVASAGEAEKSAVLAVTEKDSESFARLARAAIADVERELRELGRLPGSSAEETELLQRFGPAFEALRKIDEEVLALAVQSTNLKAYSLAFGPAADALREMDEALSDMLAGGADSPDAQRRALLACEVRAASRSIQATLAPHIAERTDAVMDALEARMRDDDLEVRKRLDVLASLRGPAGKIDLQKAISSYARFDELRAQILALSRENTNVRSLTLSLSESRRLSLQCQEILERLQRAILAEPIPGVDYGEPVAASRDEALDPTRPAPTADR
jgi:hypothetical protein